MFGALKHVWLPLVIVALVAVGGFTVYRVEGYFRAQDAPGGSPTVFEDSKPFNPKVVIYDVFSPNGNVADINYLDLNAQPQRVDSARLPWSLRLSTTDPAVSADIVAQGHSNAIGCRITVNGVVRDERISNGVNAFAFCLVKSA